MLSSGTTAANVSLASPLLDWLAVSHRVAVIINVETFSFVITDKKQLLADTKLK